MAKLRFYSGIIRRYISKPTLCAKRETALDLEPHVAHSAHDVVVITPAAFDADQFHGVLRVLRTQHQVIAGNRDVGVRSAASRRDCRRRWASAGAEMTC